MKVAKKSGKTPVHGDASKESVTSSRQGSTTDESFRDMSVSYDRNHNASKKRSAEGSDDEANWEVVHDKKHEHSKREKGKQQEEKKTASKAVLLKQPETTKVNKVGDLLLGR